MSVPQPFNEYRARLQQAFPEFQRFGLGNSGIDAAERATKIELVDLFQDSLAGPLQALPTDDAELSESGSKLIQLFTQKLSDGEQQNLVGWRYFQPLQKLTTSQAGVFARITSQLLYGEGDIISRVDEFTHKLRELLADATRNVDWPGLVRCITSFLLMLADPQEHAIIKTRQFARALKAFGYDPFPSSGLTGASYANVLALMAYLKGLMEQNGLSPRDMIDVQIFVWVGDPKYLADGTAAWALGSTPGGEDRTEEFLQKGYWQSGNGEYAGAVNAVKVGDRVALKKTSTRKHGLPFKAYGQTVSCMSVQGVGVVTENPGDGKTLRVDWEEGYSPLTIYHYTYRPRISRITGKAAEWIFNGADQPLEEIERFMKQRADSKESDEKPVILDESLADEDEEGDEVVAHHPPVNKIFFGPPATGKTRIIETELIPKYSGEDGTRFLLTTFHPSMSYEEFVEGIRPVVDDKTKELTYQVKHGVFREICDQAMNDPGRRYAILIDEINRGPVTKIFGELITLIETDKRVSATAPEKGLYVYLPHSRDKFGVPDNLDIYGTANSADRSIALMDIAFRRRFKFEEILPDPSVLPDDVDGINLQLLLSTLNERIECLLDREHRLGHGYLCGVETFHQLRDVFIDLIIPQLAECFAGEPDKLALVLVNRTTGKSELIIEQARDLAQVFGKGWESSGSRRRDSSTRYQVIEREALTKDMFAGLIL